MRPKHSMQRRGTSRFAQLQFESRWRLAGSNNPTQRFPQIRT